MKNNFKSQFILYQSIIMFFIALNSFANPIVAFEFIKENWKDKEIKQLKLELKSCGQERDKNYIALAKCSSSYKELQKGKIPSKAFFENNDLSCTCLKDHNE